MQWLWDGKADYEKEWNTSLIDANLEGHGGVKLHQL